MYTRSSLPAAATESNQSSVKANKLNKMYGEPQITNCTVMVKQIVCRFDKPVMLRTLFIPIPLILKIQYFFPQLPS